MNTLSLRHYKASLTMTARQREILDGLLLGDGHLERQQGARFARLKVEHSIRQARYVAWKYSEWRDWVRTPPRERVKRNRLGTSSWNIGFSTLSHPELETARERFYRGHRKVVPEGLVLTSLSAAVWFMDDGSKKSSQCRGVYFNTQGFCDADVKRLQALLARDANLATTLRWQSDGWQIYVPTSSIGQMVEYVGKWLLPFMHYKLPG